MNFFFLDLRFFRTQNFLPKILLGAKFLGPKMIWDTNVFETKIISDPIYWGPIFLDPMFFLDRIFSLNFEPNFLDTTFPLHPKALKHLISFVISLEQLESSSVALPLR